METILAKDLNIGDIIRLSNVHEFADAIVYRVDAENELVTVYRQELYLLTRTLCTTAEEWHVSFRPHEHDLSFYQTVKLVKRKG